MQALRDAALVLVVLVLAVSIRVEPLEQAEGLLGQADAAETVASALPAPMPEVPERFKVRFEAETELPVVEPGQAPEAPDAKSFNVRIESVESMTECEKNRLRQAARELVPHVFDATGKALIELRTICRGDECDAAVAVPIERLIHRLAS